MSDKNIGYEKPICKSSALNGEYNSAELMDVLKAIQCVVECYSCHKPLHSASVCLNGHGVCKTCKYRYNRLCPTCKSFVTDTQPFMLSKIIKLLPRVCNFSMKGCKSVVLATDNRHEMFCPYRTTECRLVNCRWRGLALNLLQHLEGKHNTLLVRNSLQELILMSFSTKLNKDGVTPIVAYNNIFWQHVRIRNGKLIQFYQYVPLGKPQEKFAAMLSFHTPETNYSSTAPVHNDTFKFEGLQNDIFCLPKGIAIALSKFHSGVHYRMEIIRKAL